MTPDGFDIYSGGGPRTGAWPQVLDVTDAVPGRTAADDPNTVVIVLKDHSVIKLPGASFTSEGRALRRFVHFYWQHPDCRDELTDGKALARLENEDFRAAS
ncbi:hypothetical protein M1247_31120 [Mycobacterium sp. 21AC1]|uniref:hypothetical protein n=1 Tax=[Mycobacterium] appelbergii TaxID=2939269 RepID=UPI0029391981|nr:hypothetical protein [Mycobacterium sp. 21AC1]MDV3129393.1 hypothetical protein [Mycobacterium sp. 21AC1]